MAKSIAKKIEAEKPVVYFRPKELTCKCGCQTNEFDADFLALLRKIRIECDFPFPLTSAYRCPKHPDEAGKTVVGAHAQGKAVDVLCSGERALKLIEVALKHGIQRIGVSQKGKSRFIHLDDGEDLPKPALWSY